MKKPRRRPAPPARKSTTEVPSRSRKRAATRTRADHADPAHHPLGCAILTVSDTRGPAEDSSGNAIAQLLEQAGHVVVSREWVKDDLVSIRRCANATLRRQRVDVLIATGGTGIALRDRTPEALAPLIELPMPGFGEMFRAFSSEQVGSAAWLSRAGAGIARGRLLVFLPGATRAVEMALSRVLIPELGHIARLLERTPKE